MYKRILLMTTAVVLLSLSAGYVTFARADTQQSIANFCTLISSNMYQGRSDYDSDRGISALQQFLVNQGYAQAVTGYFGPQTYQNVLHLQHRYGISATGYVGPLTRALIARLCGTSTQQSFALNLTGPSSLLVNQQGTWQVSTSILSGTRTSLRVDWGDQTYTNATNAQLSATTQTFTHSYIQSGTYTVTATGVDSYGRLAQATASVVVSGNTVGGLSVTSPVQGQLVLSGSTTLISWNYPVTPGSATIVLDLYTAAGAKVGTIAVSSNTIGSYSWNVPPYPNTQVCTLQYPNGLCTASLQGQYYVLASAVSGDGLATNPTVYASGRSGVFTIASTTSQTQSVTLSATPVSGTAPLAVTFGLNTDAGVYALNFGDGTSASLRSGLTTHTYSNPGTYTAQFTTDATCLHTTPTCSIATRVLGTIVVRVF